MESLPIFALAIATLIYLIVDVYPNVKSFNAILQTGSFWLLWLVFVVLNLIAWSALEVAMGAKVKVWVGHQEVAALSLIVMATLGTITILQSFTLKLADTKLVDIGALMDNYRRAVLAAVGDNVRNLRRLNEQRVALALAAKFTGRIAEMRTHYHTAFSFGGITNEQIAAELNQLQIVATANNLSFEQLLATNIVKADLSFAQSLV